MANGVEWEKKVERELGGITQSLAALHDQITDRMGRMEIHQRTMENTLRNLEVDSAVTKKVARVWAIITSTAFLGCVEGVKLWLTMS